MATWPSTLPCFLADGYQEAPKSMALESSVDGGAPKSRRRYTTSYRNINVSMNVTREQADTFEAFFENEAIDVVPFGIEHPRTKRPIACRVVDDPPYTITPVASGSKYWRLSFKLQTSP